MELTERDMYYIVRGRKSNRYVVRFFALMLAVLIPWILLTVFGGLPGAILGVVWFCGGVAVMVVYGTRTEKAQKAEAKQMFEEWQDPLRI